MISRVRNAVTKTGRNPGSKMAIMVLEDLSGSVEAVLFSEEYERHRAMVRPDRLVFLRGRVDRRREEPCLRVSEVISIEEGPARLAEGVIITLKSVGLDPGMLPALRQACATHPGDRQVFVRVMSPEQLTTVIRCDTSLSVCPDASFVAEVETLLGAGSVELAARPRRARRQPVATREAPPVDTEMVEAEESY
jgi:DNA polymerase III subunit alpha